MTSISKFQWKKYSTSIVATIVFLLSSFIPVFQIILLTLNGGLIAYFSQKNILYFYIINLLASILFLYLYHYSTKRRNQILSAIGFYCFFFPLMTFSIEKHIPQDPFFLGILTIGALAGVALMVVDRFRSARAEYSC